MADWLRLRHQKKPPKRQDNKTTIWADASGVLMQQDEDGASTELGAGGPPNGGSQPGAALIAEFDFIEESAALPIVAIPSFAIAAVTAAGVFPDNGAFTIAGDHVAVFPAGAVFAIVGSTGNDTDTYQVGSADLVGGDTVVTLSEASSPVASAVADGTIIAPVFEVEGDHTDVLSNGVAFTVAGSTGNDGSYTVDTSDFSGGNTRIFLTDGGGVVESQVADGAIVLPTVVTYTAEMPVPEGTVVQRLDLIPLAAPWGSSEALVFCGDGADEFGYIATGGVDLVNTLASPYDVGSISVATFQTPGNMWTTEQTISRDASEPTPVEGGHYSLLYGLAEQDIVASTDVLSRVAPTPGRIYDTDDTITITVVSTVDEFSSPPNGHLRIRVYYLTPVTPEVATVTTAPVP